jgi:hypothetical protein
LNGIAFAGDIVWNGVMLLALFEAEFSHDIEPEFEPDKLIESVFSNDIESESRDKL